MRKTQCYFSLFILMGILLTACNNEINKNNYYQMQDLSDGYYVIENGGNIVFPYGDRIFFADSVNGGIGFCDPRADMAYTSLSEETALAIYANEEGLFVCTGDRILCLSITGTILQEWDVVIPGYREGELADPTLCVSESAIFFVWNHGSGANIDTGFLLLDRETGDTKMYEHDRKNFTILWQYRIAPDSEDFLILANIKHAGALYNDPALLRFHADTGETELLYDCDNVSGMDLVDGVSYALDKGLMQYRLIRNPAEGELKTVLRNFNISDVTESARSVLEVPDADVFQNIDDLFYTGYDVLVWDARHSLLMIADTESPASETLHILYPVSDLEAGIKAHTGYVDMDIANFEAQYDCSVVSTYYSAAEFSDRLRMKLLAGEDDMDVIYLDRCDEGDMLSAVLRYGLYYPLENEPAVAENFKQFADGVREYMTYDGHLIGVPYWFTGRCFVVTDFYLTLGLPVPEGDWTLADFWALCETAADSDILQGGTALADIDNCIWILEAILENGCRTGKIDETAIRDAVEKLKLYHDRGILLTRNKSGSFLLDSRSDVPTIVSNYSLYDDVGIHGVLPVPSVNGSRYIPLQSFMFVYSGSENKDMAVAYMTMLSDAETTSRIDGNRSHFRKDTSEYYIASLDFSGPGEFTKVKERISEEERYLLTSLSDILPGSQIQTTSFMDNKAALQSVLDQLCSDQISVEEAVKEIVAFGNYRYLE